MVARLPLLVSACEFASCMLDSADFHLLGPFPTSRAKKIHGMESASRSPVWGVNSTGLYAILHEYIALSGVRKEIEVGRIPVCHGRDCQPTAETWFAPADQ